MFTSHVALATMFASHVHPVHAYILIYSILFGSDIESLGIFPA
jgi:hypothetical protein